MPSKNVKIIPSNYEKFLAKIRAEISQAQGKIVNLVVRQKVEMAWGIGKLVEEHLHENTDANYGKHLLQQLAGDVGISERILYQMHRFHKTYPKLPKNDERLNWSHYRILVGVKKLRERKYLEDLARKNVWSSDELAEAVKGEKKESPDLSRSFASSSSPSR